LLRTCLLVRPIAVAFLHLFANVGLTTMRRCLYAWYWARSFKLHRKEVAKFNSRVHLKQSHPYIQQTSMADDTYAGDKCSAHYCLVHGVEKDMGKR